MTLCTVHLNRYLDLETQIFCNIHTGNWGADFIFQMKQKNKKKKKIQKTSIPNFVCFKTLHSLLLFCDHWNTDIAVLIPNEILVLLFWDPMKSWYCCFETQWNLDIAVWDPVKSWYCCFETQWNPDIAVLRPNEILILLFETQWNPDIAVLRPNEILILLFETQWNPDMCTC